MADSIHVFGIRAPNPWSCCENFRRHLRRMSGLVTKAGKNSLRVKRAWCGCSPGPVTRSVLECGTTKEVPLSSEPESHRACDDLVSLSCFGLTKSTGHSTLKCSGESGTTPEACSALQGAVRNVSKSHDFCMCVTSIKSSGLALSENSASDFVPSLNAFHTARLTITAVCAFAVDRMKAPKAWSASC